MATPLKFFLPLLIALSATAQKPTYSQMDLFHQGEDGVNTYRIPALVQTKSGTLIAVVDARHDSSSDLPANISLVYRRSTDNGAHWDPQRTLVAVPSGGVGDASLLLDRNTGRIWCFFAYGPPGIGFTNSQPGTLTGPTTLQVHAIYSDTNGDMWSQPIDLTPQLKNRAWQAVFVTSGADVQLRNGHYLLALVVRDGDGVLHSVDAISADNGMHWKVGSFIADGTDESHPVEMRNGMVKQNMRTRGPRAIAMSTNGGETFGPVIRNDTLLDPGCNAGITRYDHGKTHLMLFTNDMSTRRENLTIRASYDDGVTWPIARTLYPGPSAYSTVLQLKDGSIAMLYEYGQKSSVERIGFAHFDLNWLLAR